MLLFHDNINVYGIILPWGECMGISIIKKNIEEKFNPFIDIENFFNRENYEELFIDYYNDFYNKYILSFVGDNLSSSELNRINKEVVRLIDKKMLSICRNLLNEYNLSSSDVTSLYERINILKELVLIYSIPNNSDNEVFITISSTEAKVKLYASGEKEPLTSTNKDSYINNLNLELYYLNSNGIW